ncbi:1-acyl-sn-glycerol-3-phosphate acyltransferase [Mucilaginibacter myungsuensis]|uniref:1-acyl-sn-glycerol-3-phosphate acyltransferase n=1 Tax=Mucilaginibacter myungsuensis TaxID=649104 RepID=A0A929PX28_9SPHI|nr:1-acyl-sn-glycerol-3-phosphate acyltransferase [Mucilaginibacter myungsuensis]MBE9661807.1 1-acyl-sn-glycerol-3-phosphate acyltransferase [Mucilaginibacter myungsuensis]MDN3599759.1 1-acyl-sn-glycerol-3-phosphate acyltransferase [Mucilaginibacter myungsuensis]
MIIKAKPLSPFFFKLINAIISFGFNRFLNKKIIHDVPIKPGHSYILMCNHFSFTDGMYAYYLSNKVFWGKDKMQRLYAMSLKKQMQKNSWLQHTGSFSIDPGKRSIKESFAYAGEVLSTPGNLLLYYPQGNLESQHITHIHFESGLAEIVPLIQGKCQIIWCSVVLEFFESIKPSAHFNMLDLGTNEDFDFEAVKLKVNEFHRECLNKNVRFTNKPIG